MKINELYIIKHLRDTYGGIISGAGDCLYVEINGDKFRVNLTDKKRFGYYTFFHRDSGRHLDGKYYYHKRSGEVVLNGSEDWKLPVGGQWNNKTSTCAFMINKGAD